jgi:DNA-binding NtrC family response regulator
MNIWGTMDLTKNNSACRSILVLEDYTSIREAICMVLEGLKYSVYSARDKVAFARLIEDKDFDIFITDLNIADPCFNGNDASLIMRKIKPSIPIALITTQMDTHPGVQRFRRLSPKTQIIFKPFTVTDLENALGFLSTN